MSLSGPVQIPLRGPGQAAIQLQKRELRLRRKTRSRTADRNKTHKQEPTQKQGRAHTHQTKKRKYPSEGRLPRVGGQAGTHPQRPQGAAPLQRHQQQQQQPAQEHRQGGKATRAPQQRATRGGTTTGRRQQPKAEPGTSPTPAATTTSPAPRPTRRVPPQPPQHPNTSPAREATTGHRANQPETATHTRTRPGSKQQPSRWCWPARSTAGPKPHNRPWEHDAGQSARSFSTG